MNIQKLIERLGRDGTIEFLMGELEEVDCWDFSMALIAIKNLAYLKADEAFDRIVELSQHEEFLVRIESFTALMKIDQEKGFPHIEQGLGDDDQSVRTHCAELLGEAENKEKAISALKEALSDRSMAVKLSAAKALGMQGCKDGHRLALGVLEGRSDRYKEEAVEALAEIGINDDETISAIEAFIQDESVAYAALERLGRKQTNKRRLCVIQAGWKREIK